MKAQPVIGVVTALSLLVGTAIAQQTAPESSLAAARAAYDQRADPTRATAALELFQKAAIEDGRAYEPRWEGARAAYYLGTYARATAPDAEKMAIFTTGIGLAKDAVALNAKGAEGHFWLGVLWAVYGEAKGIFKSLSLVPTVKGEMQTSLDIDPAVEGWGPDRTLGRVYFKLPFFKGGDNKKSIEHLERSRQGAPTNALTMLYLAETCRSEGMKPRAIELLRLVVTMTPDPRWIAEHALIKAQAEKLLKKLE
jgi:tetratricopeptide (TPR) repeat protein